MANIDSYRRPEVTERWRREVLEPMLEENRNRPPWPCDCGRGMVTSIHGCDTCRTEGARAFEQELLNQKPSRRR